MTDGDVLTRESVIEREMDDRRTETHSRIEDTQVKCDKPFSTEARGGC